MELGFTLVWLHSACVKHSSLVSVNWAQHQGERVSRVGYLLSPTFKNVVPRQSHNTDMVTYKRHLQTRDLPRAVPSLFTAAANARCFQITSSAHRLCHFQEETYFSRKFNCVNMFTLSRCVCRTDQGSSSTLGSSLHRGLSDTI